MKKIIKYISTICLTMFFILSALSMTKVLEVKSSSTSLSFVSATNTSQVNSSDSIFLVDIEFSRVFDDFIYIYDGMDDTLKIMDKQTKTFRENNNQFKAGSIKDLIVYKDVIMLLNTETNNFTCINKNDFNSIEFDQTSLTTLSNAKFIKTITVNQKDYLLLCPENPIDGIGQFELAEMSYEENVISITNIQKFSVGSDFSASLSTYNNIYIEENDNKIFIMMVTNNNILSFSVDPLNIQSTFTQITAVTGLSTSTNVLSVDMVKLAETTTAIAITSEDSIKFYTLNIGSTSVNLSLIDDKIINIENNFLVNNAHANESTLVLTSKENQKIKIINFNQNNDEFYLEDNIKNSEITIEYLSPTEFEYLEAIKATKQLELPYSKTYLTLVDEGDELVIIGKGKDENGNYLTGWHYCMFTKNNTNYYGFVSGLDFSKKSNTSYSKTYITVQAYTNLYLYPSKICDSKNIEIKVIPTYSRLEVLNSTCDYLNKKYLLVKVNNDSIGFIDRERIIDLNGIKNRIIPDATVMRDNSEIFSSNGDDREVLMELNKGYRVKIIGKRDTITNFTLVTFNDEEGNEFTGYIYTYNLEMDSWSTLQIIGIIFVIINVVLLAIIIILKNKLTR